VILNATPLHKRLLELYDTLSQIGGAKPHRLGSRGAFERRYLIKNPTHYYVRDPRTGIVRKRTKLEITGHRHLDEFREIISPMVLRRSLDEIDDVELPSIQPENVFLELHPAQRAAYESLQRDVMDMIRGNTLGVVPARNKLVVGQQICEGMAAAGGLDGPGTSVKFDWLMNQLHGNWAPDEEGRPGEKAVVFVKYKNGIRALGERLRVEGVGYELLWGEERRPKIREASLDRFREDPDCRVLLGTSAMEKSLNLQIARHLVNVDQLPNPARMTQLSGRIRRQGSRFRTVYVHNLLAAETHEERVLGMLGLEAGLSSTIWQEDDALYGSLSPIEIATLIAPQARRTRAPRVRTAS
jgi:SNF2 family DNA or RNA helicase